MNADRLLSMDGGRNADRGWTRVNADGLLSMDDGRNADRGWARVNADGLLSMDGGRNADRGWTRMNADRTTEEVGSVVVGEDHTLPLEFGAFEVDDQADREFGDP